MKPFSPCMVLSAPGILVSVRAPLRHLCPFRQEVDNGFVEIEWVTGKATYELHSLREELKAFEDLEISHEDLTTFIQQELGKFPHMVSDVSVETAWGTAGMEVRCSTLQTPVDPQ